MFARRRIPVAWLGLTHNKPRLLAALGGVAFAVVLMFVEMGFLNGLYDSQTYVVEMLNADLVMIHRHKEAVLPRIPFPRKRLVQARGHEAIRAAYPVYLEEHRAVWKNSRDQREHPILVFGFDPSDPVFLMPEVGEHAAELNIPDTALIDTHSKDLFGDLLAGTTGELSRRAIRIVGTFPLGPDFRVDGNLIVSGPTFFKCFTDPRNQAAEISKVEFGVLRVAPGADLPAVRASLQESLPDDVLVLTKPELVERVKNYWANAQPVGYVFGLGALVGFLIGVTICYQILYTDIVDHLPQYATLKAVGFSNQYLVQVVLQKALYLAILGFVPGLIGSRGVYAILQGISGIRMQLTLGRGALVFGLTVAMCMVSGLIAIRKVIQSDPAEVF